MSSPSVNDPHEVAVQLRDDEWQLLWLGSLQFGGPAYVSDDMARAIGYADAGEFYEDRARLGDLLKANGALSTLDWQRAIVATEIAVTSLYYGAGDDWELASGIDDAESMRRLRSIQSKVLGAGAFAPPSSRVHPDGKARRPKGPR